MAISETNPHLRIRCEHIDLFEGYWKFVGGIDQLANPQELVVEYIDRLGFALKQHEILLITIPPFADFSYVMLLTQASVLLIFGLRSQRSVRHAIFHDLRQMSPPPTLSAYIADMESKYKWTNCKGISFPTDLISPSLVERTITIEGS